MNETLHIALIQSDLVWENPTQNRANFTQKIASIDSPVDLIVLPEMFTTGFTMNPVEVAETMNGKTVLWLKETAKNRDCAITGSIIVIENGNYYNRLLFIKPDGSYITYDKHHLFTLANEHIVYTAGQKQNIITYKGWKIKPQICYDLRFPVWARNTTDYDILLYVASWPKIRIDAWDVLLKARAIENMSYCIGVNRIGIDDKGYIHNGHSVVYDPLGISIIAETLSEEETILYTTLSKLHVLGARKKLSFLDDKDTFSFIT